MCLSQPFIHQANWGKVCYSIALVLIIECAVVGTASCQAKPNEYQVKAVYLYNFGKFIRWPAVSDGDNNRFAICVLGEDPFGASLNVTVTGETINGANIVATRISKPEDALNCRIVFISASESSRLKQILLTLDHSSVLTVSDLPQFSQHGGMVGFVFDGKKVRFEVNLTPVEHAGLTFSSELLKLAANVHKNGSGD